MANERYIEQGRRRFLGAAGSFAALSYREHWRHGRSVYAGRTLRAECRSLGDRGPRRPTSSRSAGHVRRGGSAEELRGFAVTISPLAARERERSAAMVVHNRFRPGNSWLSVVDLVRPARLRASGATARLTHSRTISSEQPEDSECDLDRRENGMACPAAATRGEEHPGALRRLVRPGGTNPYFAGFGPGEGGLGNAGTGLVAGPLGPQIVLPWQSSLPLA